MNPATEKMFNNAIGRIHFTQVEAQNIQKRGPKAVKLWKAFAKAEPDNDLAKKVVKDVVPIVEKLIKKSKPAIQSLDKLQDAGDKPHDYYDGKEFRDRTKKLLEPGADFDRDVATVVLSLARFPNGGMFPLCKTPDVVGTVKYLKGFMNEWNALKLAINRI